MKLKNIFAIFTTLLLVVSCSSDSDSTFNTESSVLKNEVYAALTFDLNTESNLTKSTSSVDNLGLSVDAMSSEEEEVNECFVFVANGDEIIGRHHYSNNEMTKSVDGKTTTLSSHILVKVSKTKPDLIVFVVGLKSDDNNTFTNVFNTFTTLSSLKQYTFGQNSMNQGNSIVDFLKTGEFKILSADYDVSERTTDFECLQTGGKKCGHANLVLTMRAAAIQLKSFKVMSGASTIIDLPSSYGPAAIKAVIEDIIIDKQVLNTVLHSSPAKTELSDVEKVMKETSFLESYNAKTDEQKLSLHPLNYRFYSYQNSTSKTKIMIKYKINNIPGECSFYIKTDGIDDVHAKVLAGNLYELNVQIKNATVSIQVVTKDWQHNVISNEMIEIPNI